MVTLDSTQVRTSGVTKVPESPMLEAVQNVRSSMTDGSFWVEE